MSLTIRSHLVLRRVLARVLKMNLGFKPKTLNPLDNSLCLHQFLDQVQMYLLMPFVLTQMISITQEIQSLLNRWIGEPDSTLLLMQHKVIQYTSPILFNIYRFGRKAYEVYNQFILASNKHLKKTLRIWSLNSF